MVATRTDRRIQRVPALHVAQLAAAKLLPSLPPEVEAVMQRQRRRDVTLAEASALSWLISGPIDCPNGVAAYRNMFDFASGSDAREIVHIAGKRRAVVELMQHMVEHARSRGLRVLGSVHVDNKDMMRLLSGLGYVRARIVFEDR